MRTPDECTTCRVRLITRRKWYAATIEERRELRARGVHQHKARGLCPPCYRAALDRDSLVDHERLVRSRAEVLEEYERLGRRVGESRAERCRRLAPRIGMTWAALERALDRAGVAA